MKIVHVCVAGYQPILSPDGGAVQRRILELSRVQARNGHDVTAFSAGRSNDEMRVDGVSVRIIRCVTRMPWRHAEYLARLLLALMRGPRPDVLNFHGQPEGVVIAKVLRRPAVLFYDYFYYRGGRYALLYRFYRRLLLSFDLLLPCSEYCLAGSLDYWKLDSRKPVVQYNGVNLAQFRPDRDAGSAERTRLKIDGPVVLYVGRVNSQKGTDVLLEGFTLLKQRMDDVSLVVAGPISQFGEQRDLEAARVWTRRIQAAGGRYVGPVDEDRLAAVYNIADVFVMPTRTLEMFGMAAVEAQACGVPVVASDHGGLRETVPEECGGRFPPGDAAALAVKLRELLEDVDQRKRCADAAIANAARYSWDRVVSDLDAQYARIGIRG